MFWRAWIAIPSCSFSVEAVGAVAGAVAGAAALEVMASGAVV